MVFKIDNACLSLINCTSSWIADRILDVEVDVVATVLVDVVVEEGTSSKTGKLVGRESTSFSNSSIVSRQSLTFFSCVFLHPISLLPKEPSRYINGFSRLIENFQCSPHPFNP